MQRLSQENSSAARLLSGLTVLDQFLTVRNWGIVGHRGGGVEVWWEIDKLVFLSTRPSREDSNKGRP